MRPLPARRSFSRDRPGLARSGAAGHLRLSVVGNDIYNVLLAEAEVALRPLRLSRPHQPPSKTPTPSMQTSGMHPVCPYISLLPLRVVPGDSMIVIVQFPPVMVSPGSSAD